MLERVESALIFYPMLPMGIKKLLKDFAAEFDRQRKDIDELRSLIKKDDEK